MAHLDGERSARLDDLAWWDEVRSAVRESVAAGRPRAARNDAGLRRTSSPRSSRRTEGAACRSGSCTATGCPWNQARRRATGELVVWDWEYADPQAPLGLDAIHARYQTERLLRGRSDLEAFAVAHATVDARARGRARGAGALEPRCRASLLGADDDATVGELQAAAERCRIRAGSRTCEGDATS